MKLIDPLFFYLPVDVPGVCHEICRGHLQDSDLSKDKLRDRRGVDLQRAQPQQRLQDQRPARHLERTREFYALCTSRIVTR